MQHSVPGGFNGTVIEFSVKSLTYPHGVCLFTSYLYVVFLSEFLCHTSIVAYLQALRFMSYRLRFPVPEISHPEIGFILRGIKRCIPHTRTPSEPMRWAYFKKLYKTIPLSSPLGCQFWTACLFMFRSLLRILHFIPS